MTGRLHEGNKGRSCLQAQRFALLACVPAGEGFVTPRTATIPINGRACSLRPLPMRSVWGKPTYHSTGQL